MMDQIIAGQFLRIRFWDSRTERNLEEGWGGGWGGGERGGVEGVGMGWGGGWGGGEGLCSTTTIYY